MVDLSGREGFPARSTYGLGAGRSDWASQNASNQLDSRAERAAAQPVTDPFSPIVLAGVVRAIDFALIASLGVILYAHIVMKGGGLVWHYTGASLTIAVLCTLAFQIADICQVQSFRALGPQASRMSVAWTLVFGVAAAIVFLGRLEDYFSRLWLGTWYLVGLAMLLGWRGILFLAVRTWTRAGRLDRRTVIVGAGDNGDAFIAALKRQQDCDVKIVGIFDDRNDVRAPSAPELGVEKLGPVEDLVEFARRTRVDLVVFTLPITAETRILSMLKKLWVLPADIRLSAHSNKLRFRPRTYSYIGNMPLLDMFEKPIADWDVVMKWLFDKFVGTLALLLLAPVMALVALAVKLDSPGPILFRQKRYGFNNELIEVFKFRSMHARDTDQTARKLVTKDDPRVTRVGRFIRKTSLDELPQLFNVVFKGNLSLVGPRPHAIHATAANRIYDEVVDGYFARHRVKPGITGWAQINGWRGETDTPEKIQRRVEHDLYYIENWSVLFDLYILARTPLTLLKAENAY